MPWLDFPGMKVYDSSSFTDLIQKSKVGVPSYVRDPAFSNWFNSLPEGQRKIRREPFFFSGRVQNTIIPYYGNRFNDFKVQSGLEAERRTQANLESRGLVYNSPFFPRGFDVQKFLINNPVRYNNTNEAVQRNRFNFRSA